MTTLNKVRFLVLIDNIETSAAALKFACLKAKKDNLFVELMIVANTAHERPILFSAIDNVNVEAHEKAQEILHQILVVTEHFPDILIGCNIAIGSLVDNVLKTIDEGNNISMLVTGIRSFESRGNNIPLTLFTKIGDKLTIPILVIPSNLTEQQINILI